jgi:hypothetical protein
LLYLGSRLKQEFFKKSEILTENGRYIYRRAGNGIFKIKGENMGFSLINRRGGIFHLCNEYSGVTKHPGSMQSVQHLGSRLKQIAERQREMGLNVRVVLPKTAEMDLKGFDKNEGYWLKMIHDVPVYVLNVEFSGLYPTGASATDEYENFAKGFMGMLAQKDFGKIAIVHAHDYGMGLTLHSMGKIEEVSKIFTIYDPINFDTTFPLKEEHPEIFHDPFNGFNHEGKISGLKAGVWGAAATTIWSRGYFEDLCKGTYGSFLKSIEQNRDPFFALSENWKPSGQDDIPPQIIDAFSCAYLRALFGKGHQFSVNLMDEPVKDQVDRLVFQIHERRPNIDPRGPIVEKDLANTFLGKIKDVTAVRRISEIPAVSEGLVSKDFIVQNNISMAHLDNIGGIQQIFDVLFGEKYEEKGLYYALLNGGVGERLMNICMAAGGIKGEVRFGHTNLSKIVIEQASMVANQLPDGGKGFVVMFGNDNLMLPYGPMKVGDHLLGNATQQMFLFAKPERIKHADKDKLRGSSLKELGTLIADPKSGDLKECYEKKIKDGQFDVDFIEERLDVYGAENCHVNTFYMTMSVKAAKKFHELFSQKTRKNGKPFTSTYQLNWAPIFVEGSVVGKDEWMKRYDNSKFLYNGKPVGEVFDRKDWESLWDFANILKKKFGPIGVVDIGQKAIWSDVGLVKQLSSLYFDLVSAESDDKIMVRRIANLPIHANIAASSMKDVKVADEGDVLVNHSVFKKGGSIGKHCVVIDCLFEEYIEIPNNTIMIGSHIYKWDNNPPNGSIRPQQNADKFIYCVHKKPECKPFWFKNYTAVSSMIIHDGSISTGEFPLELTGQEKVPKDPPHEKEQILGYYVKDGAMKKQTIRGMAHSVANAKYDYSLTNTRQAYDKLCAEIDLFMKQEGTIK